MLIFADTLWDFKFRCTTKYYSRNAYSNMSCLLYNFCTFFFTQNACSDESRVHKLNSLGIRTKKMFNLIYINKCSFLVTTPLLALLCILGEKEVLQLLWTLQSELNVLTKNKRCKTASTRHWPRILHQRHKTVTKVSDQTLQLNQIEIFFRQLTNNQSS